MSQDSGDLASVRDAGRGPGLLAWGELERSDFFRWFGMHVVGRSVDPERDWSAVQLEPGGHQQAIDLVVHVDARHQVLQAVLSLERGWVDGGQTAKLADDLIQSFLLAFAGRHPDASALARDIVALERGSLPQIHRADASVGPTDLPNPAVQAALAVYRDGAGRAELIGPGLLTTLNHVRETSGLRLVIDVATTRSASTSAPTTQKRKLWWRFW
ncbi:MAG: hypothetical protein IT305_17545 [Chloroflexi bacterium]|nr:hypothetical protein [Chloroflexota bacterium]